MLGIALYVLSTIYISYLSFQEFITLTTWNGLIWLIILLATVISSSKSFGQEENRSNYYYYLVNPSSLLLSKVISQLIVQLVLSLIILILLTILLPINGNIGLSFMLNLFAGSMGLGLIFTLVSVLSSKSESKGSLIPVLGFPLSIPVLILAISNSKLLLNGSPFADIQGNFATLLSIIAIIIASSFLLFPYTWKN